MVLVCLMVTPATPQDRQEKGGKGAKCRNPTVRKILNEIQLISLSQGWENQDGFYIDGCTNFTCTQVKNKIELQKDFQIDVYRAIYRFIYLFVRWARNILIVNE